MGLQEGLAMKKVALSAGSVKEGKGASGADIMETDRQEEEVWRTTGRRMEEMISWKEGGPSSLSSSLKGILQILQPLGNPAVNHTVLA